MRHHVGVVLRNRLNKTNIFNNITIYRQNLILFQPHEDELNMRFDPQFIAEIMVSCIRDENIKYVFVRGMNIIQSIYTITRVQGKLLSYISDFYTHTPNHLSLSDETSKLLRQIVEDNNIVFVQTESMLNKVEQDIGRSCRHFLLPPQLPDTFRDFSADAKFDPEHIHIGYTGNVAPNWGLEELISCAENLAQHNIPVRLHIGIAKIHKKDATFVQSIKTLLQKSFIVRYEQLSRATSVELMSRMDYAWCYRQPEHADNTLELSTKLVESSALGVPCLCYPSRINKSLLGDDYPYFATSLDDARLFLAKKPSRSGRLISLANKIFCNQSFSWTSAEIEKRLFQKQDCEISRTLIPVAMAADDNYALPLCVAMESILYHAHRETFYEFYLLVPGVFSQEHKDIINSLQDKYMNCCKILFINMDSFLTDGAIRTHHITLQTYYRLFLDKIIDYDKVIYLDTDIIAHNDLTSLYNIDISAYYVAGVKAPSYVLNKERNKFRIIQMQIESIDQYINAGVLLLNMKKIREDGLFNSIYDLIQFGFMSEDQDIINKLSFNKIKHLPPKYNMMYPRIKEAGENIYNVYEYKDVEEALEHPVIIHYLNVDKPWNTENVPYSEMWYNFFITSPYANIDSSKNIHSLFLKYKQTDQNTTIPSQIPSTNIFIKYINNLGRYLSSAIRIQLICLRIYNIIKKLDLEVKEIKKLSREIKEIKKNVRSSKYREDSIFSDICIMKVNINNNQQDQKLRIQKLQDTCDILLKEILSLKNKL
jgi:lipopolysaccharide biosynthesis glycosyltransferase/glycosyltransferase involved in cell wall biosynthesis